MVGCFVGSAIGDGDGAGIGDAVGAGCGDAVGAGITPTPRLRRDIYSFQQLTRRTIHRRRDLHGIPQFKLALVQ